MSTRPQDSHAALEDEISLLALASVLLRHRWTVVRASLGLAVLTAVFVAWTPITYTATASFLPQGSGAGGSGIGALAGLAGQFGISVPSSGGGETPEFYALLVKSRVSLSQIAEHSFTLTEEEAKRAPAQSGTLAELLEIGDEDVSPEKRRHDVAQWLAQTALSVGTGRQTGMITVSVTTPWSSLSEALAQQVLDLVNDFNLQTRRSQAAAERAFVEGRLAEARDSLRAAEDRLARFLETNRQWEGSPELSFQRDRLQRQLLTQQQVFTGLTEAYGSRRSVTPL